MFLFLTPVLPVQSRGMSRRIVFVGTSKSGLGHLRRIASVAAGLAKHSGGDNLVLITNAKPAGLTSQDLAAFATVCVCARQDMAARLSQEGCDLAVLDTVELPGFQRYHGPSALILRETPHTNLEKFRRAGSRPWDVLIVPNPPDAWRPDVGPDYARSVVHTGWILRETGLRGDSPSSGIVVATGGGGTADTRRGLYPVLDKILRETRHKTPHPLRIRQALGPRAGGEALDEADEVFDPGSELNEAFRRADVVISTAGYNSVLELASTDTPTLLVAIPRSLDDQLARVRHWGPLLGHGLTPGHEQEAADWLADQMAMPRRRAPVDLGSAFGATGFNPTSVGRSSRTRSDRPARTRPI